MNYGILLCSLCLLCLVGCAIAPQQPAHNKDDVTLCFKKVNCAGLTDEKCLYMLQGCSEVFR